MKEKKVEEGVVVEGETRERFPYSESPLLIFAEEEKRIFPEKERVRNVDAMVRIADGIADRTAAGVLEYSRRKNPSASMQDALRAVGSNEEGLKVYMTIVAEELRRAGCVMQLEASLSDAVDSTKNAPGTFHLDCDLLCYAALHCAARHDMPLAAYCAPYHMYLGSPAFSDFAIEMTEFRPALAMQLQPIMGFRIPVNPDQLGGGYFSSHAEQRAKNTSVSHEVEENLGWYRPIPHDQIFHDIAVGCLLWDKVGDAKEDIAILESVCDLADQELRRVRTHRFVAQAAYYAHANAMDVYLGRLDEGGSVWMRALEHARRLKEIRSQYERFLTDVVENEEQCLKALEEADREKALPGAWKSLH